MHVPLLARPLRLARPSVQRLLTRAICALLAAPSRETTTRSYLPKTRGAAPMVAATEPDAKMTVCGFVEGEEDVSISGLVEHLSAAPLHM